MATAAIALGAGRFTGLMTKHTATNTTGARAQAVAKRERMLDGRRRGF